MKLFKMNFAKLQLQKFQTFLNVYVPKVKAVNLSHYFAIELLFMFNTESHSALKTRD